ncbi:FxLYD domain-containing protein [Dyella terrae]|uniref:FxLYD domain-containing protein n=1 Tax=Dyella terrae TaxID=522259 RepID=UPI001EFCF525|nr:FxLYD domain-containing protein [Dyella terrae]ULU24607.1 FxLYD domain-containing protein [Dyella terrae]
MNFRSTALVLLVSLGLASSGAWAATPAKPSVRVGSYRVERDVTPGRNKVVGTLTNVGHKPVHSAKVSFRLFDAKGHAIGRATDEVHDLGPGQSQKFHASARGNVSRARLLRVETR